MRKFFQIFGMVSLFVFSLIMTNKTSEVVKEYDDVMIHLNQIASSYEIKEQLPIIKNDTIIPGIQGKEVDIKKSYYRMKKIGSFDEKLLKYKYKKQTNSLKNNINKYIIKGRKNTVALVFKVDSNTNEILNILKEKEVKGNFFVSNDYINTNNDYLDKILTTGHNVGNFSTNFNFLDESFIWLNKLIKKSNNQDKQFCLNENKNKDELDLCSINNHYTITPNIILKNNLLLTVRNSLESGSIISMNTNQSTIKELGLIINYIKSKGYKIVTLEEHLKE